MSIRVRLFRGSDCAQPDKNCVISLGTNDSPETKFNPLSKYFLTRGNLTISYNGDSATSITSPYNSSWSSYVDSWNYSKDVSLNVQADTNFVSISVLNSSNAAVAFNASAMQLSTGSITKSMAQNTILVIVGESYSVDTQEYTDQKCKTVFARESREITISATSLCELIYIE